MINRIDVELAAKELCLSVCQKTPRILPNIDVSMFFRISRAALYLIAPLPVIKLVK